MPKNKVNDPITDQEIAFARLVLAGAMTDRQAAEAVGLNPDSAAYTKAKPRVRAYMLEHRAAVQQQLVQQEADLSRRTVEGQRRLNLDREQVLARLWEIANLSPEMTRGSITGQVKALSMIVAMQNLIPDRPAVDRLATSSEKKSSPAPDQPPIYAAAWRRGPQQATTIQPPPDPPTPQEQEGGLGVPASLASPASPGVPRSVAPSVPWKPNLAPASVGDQPPAPSIQPVPPAQGIYPSETPTPSVPLFTSVPDLRIPLAIKKNPFNPFVRPR